MRFLAIASSVLLLIVAIGPVHAVTNAAEATERLHKELYPNGNVKYEAMVDDHGGSRIIRWFNEDGNPKEGLEREASFERRYKGGVVVALNEYYPNGRLKSEGLVTNNTVLVQREYDDTGQPKSGIHRETFSNGNYVESAYQNGKKDGIERRYEHGSLLIHNVWVDGTREYEKVLSTNGLVKRTVWYRNGTQETRKDFLDDGALDQVRTTEGGVEAFRRYSGGTLSIEYRGRQYTSYQKDGSVLELGAYDENQRRDGLQRLFDDAGHIRREMMWSHGKLDGTNRTFYGSGRLRCEAICSQDRFVRGAYFDEDGGVTNKGINEQDFLAEFGLWNWDRNREGK